MPIANRRTPAWGRGVSTNPKFVGLMQRMREVLRVHQYSLATERNYLGPMS